MKIIGLSGKKQSGKDTIYRLSRDLFVEANKEARVGRVAFGDSLKQEVSEITGFRMDFIEEHKDRFRELLQVWGTEFRREFFGYSYWIDKMAEILQKSEPRFDLIFITDVRFKNEAEYIKELGGLNIRVERRAPQTYHTLQEIESLDLHKSENDMDDYSQFDYVINNDKSPDELEKAVKDMLTTLNFLETNA
jgi:phosphomevalonate kinase